MRRTGCCFELVFFHCGVWPYLLTCLSEPQRQTRQTQTNKTAPPRDTEKTQLNLTGRRRKTQSCCMKSSYHENFSATNFLRCFNWFFIRLSTRHQNAPQKTAPNHPPNTSMTASYPTSDSHFLHEFPRIFAHFSCVQNHRCMWCFLVSLGPFLHENFLFLSC